MEETERLQLEIEKLKLEAAAREAKEADNAKKVAQFKATGKLWHQGDNEDVSFPRFSSQWYQLNEEVLVEESETFVWVARKRIDK